MKDLIKVVLLALVVVGLCVFIGFAISKYPTTITAPTPAQVQHIADSVRSQVEWEQLEEHRAELLNSYPN